MARRIVIIGGGATGTTAAMQARRVDRTAQICLVEKEMLPEYSRCGLPYAYSGVVSRPEDLITHPESFYENTIKVQLRLGTEATKINPNDNSVSIRKISTKVTENLPYDCLVLATGAVPALLPIKGVEKKGVFVIRTIRDIQQLANHVPETESKTVVIVGGGLIGMEMAEALLRKNLRVVVVELLPEILPAVLDPDMATTVRRFAEEEGARILIGTRIDEILGHDSVEGVVVGEEHIESQTIIVAANVRPDTVLAKDAGIAIGETGGIVVDDHMHTSVPNIYAAGDCVETICAITGRKTLLQLATTAIRQAVVAGDNAAGGNRTYWGSTGVATTRLFSHEIATAGLTTATAVKYGLSPLSTRVTARSRLHYMPDASDITAKLICDTKDKRLIGAQIIGEGASLRANFASLAMRFKLDIEAFQNQETCYAPPNAPVWDPMTLAAQGLERKLEVRQTRVAQEELEHH